MTVYENDDFELEVRFYPEEIDKVMWFCNNQPLEGVDSYHIVTTNGKSTLKVPKTQKKRIGKYEVVVEKNNIVSKSASTVKLIKVTDDDIVKPPVFIKSLEPKEVCYGDIVLLETEVVSNPCASFQWFIGNKDVITYTKQSKIHNIYITNKDNISCLCIENINKEQVEVITCRAENFGGSVSCSASIVLKNDIKEVTGIAPEFVVPLKSATVMDGDQILLNCTVVGEPWPKIYWYHDKKLIEWARDISVGRQESGLCEIRIKEAFPEMSGTYSCVATNEYGSSRSECIVTVEGRSSYSDLKACVILINIIKLHGECQSCTDILLHSSHMYLPCICRN